MVNRIQIMMESNKYFFAKLSTLKEHHLNLLNFKNQASKPIFIFYLTIVFSK